jgi:ABC-type metal ion transport system substrate-binding protein
MKFKNFIQIIFTTAILMCGSCSSRDNDNSIVTKTYTDSQITEMVQKDALKYFWDYAQTNSKLARERYHTR